MKERQAEIIIEPGRHRLLGIEGGSLYTLLLVAGLVDAGQPLTDRLRLEKGWGVGMEKWNAQCRGADGRTTPKEERDRMHLSAPQPSVFRYQHKVREALNPNELGDEYFETLDVDP